MYSISNVPLIMKITKKKFDKKFSWKYTTFPYQIFDQNRIGNGRTILKKKQDIYQSMKAFKK